MSGTIAVPEGLGPYLPAFPPVARKRVRRLLRDKANALRAGDLLRARGFRQSLDILAIWYLPDEILEVGV